MILAIIGSRTYKNYNEMYQILHTYFCKHDYDDDYGIRYCFDEIISGGASGADSLAARFAKEHNNIKLTEYLPDWEQFGKPAGMIRNKAIIENSDFVLAFWDGKSPGTKNSLSLAKKLKKKTMIVYF